MVDEIKDTEPTAESRILDEIVHAGEAPPDDVPSPESDPTPVEGNAVEKPSPESGQLEDEAGVQSGDERPDAEKASDEADPEKSEDPPKVEEPESEEETRKKSEAFEDDLLGGQALEPDTVESLRERYAESSKESHRLNEEIGSFRAALTELGLNAISVSDGKIGLVPTDKYFEDLNVDNLMKQVDLTKIFDALSEEEQETLGTEPEGVLKTVAKKILKDASGLVLGARPPVTASVEDVEISEGNQAKVYEEFKAEKLRDGVTPRHVDADNTEVVRLMSKAFMIASPAMDEFRKWAYRSEDNYAFALRNCWLEAYHVRSRQGAVADNASAELERKKIENKKGLSVHVGGKEIAPEAMNDKATKNTHDSILESIVSATPT